MASTSPTARGRFAGGDPAYLRDVQYRDPSRLTVRATLHQRYGTAPEPWFPWVVSQVGWPSSGDVLEVGCGPGWLWVEAHDAVPAELRLTLTDLSLGMVTTARERVLASSTVHLVAAGSANVQALPFTDAAFDVAIANHMLYHAPDPAVAVRELARVLRPGGVLVSA
ncbi:MAG TPA: class I SAM-dependent methyltransferase, partial [Acidimicrobiales bacterium]|nr:class I SAM-dependent methyltransferase [Acidimicrobiales bacterium]